MEGREYVCEIKYHLGLEFKEWSFKSIPPRLPAVVDETREVAPRAGGLSSSSLHHGYRSHNPSL